MADIINNNEWLLGQDFEKTRVVTQEDVKLYRERTILAYLEGATAIAALFADNPVPVESDDGKLIGTANVSIQNSKLIAELVIDYATPERLNAENRDGVRHWARIVGMLCTQPSMAFVDVSRPSLTLTVDKLVLSTHRPADGRLLAFGEPIL